MIMYHGTSLKRGNKILKDGMLKKNAPKVYGKTHLFPTTDGYVYLTNDLINAIYYGNKTAVLEDNDSEFLVFCIDIDQGILEADKDEVNYTLKPFGLGGEIKDMENPTLEESLKYTLSARVGEDIDFQEHETKYVKILSSIGPDLHEQRRITQEVVSLRSHHNEHANKYKNDFISKLKWIECTN